jgi:hypothetical protein
MFKKNFNFNYMQFLAQVRVSTARFFVDKGNYRWTHPLDNFIHIVI